uniref:Transmembrane protein 230 isoform X1 n=2 Tax=Elaeis guineensis var. tenera TaxID=51953 RepID=A0A6I9SQ53_ELAGV|nr:transmembrane protein 230 isoform X1 [Elaeis guineensis]
MVSITAAYRSPSGGPTEMTSRRHVRYTPLAGDEGDDDSGMVREEDLRFAYNPKALDRVPRKSIALALFLLAIGSVLLFLSFFILTGHMQGERSQAYGLMVLGILAFLPGFYETRIAYYSWRGAPGYRFASIPDK